jgi:hypothetical protein
MRGNDFRGSRLAEWTVFKSGRLRTLIDGATEERASLSGNAFGLKGYKGRKDRGLFY